ncbi:hypothetical protein BegalDRAFT_2095 [Beggiatoa alba B18LD]|uniref:Uncharacterized protein n=1 Tax=Beggiatoa alba B18LD TaxID=395493 RepID=I3CH67_9GAMM|nr:hypothetical protein [Beggiatoa alba]EIJ42960.1 hypothetical protein BegalDRAFT_2095 [Beggiatoa alba B18LD]
MVQQTALAIAQEKKAHLQKALILETDPSVKFKLDHEIKELEAQIQALSGDVATSEADLSSYINNNQINGNNNKIQIIVNQWQWWGIGFISLILLLALIMLIYANPNQSQVVTGDCNTVVAGGNGTTSTTNCTPTK